MRIYHFNDTRSRPRAHKRLKLRDSQGRLRKTPTHTLTFSDIKKLRAQKKNPV